MPVKNYRTRIKKEFLGHLSDGAGKRILSRVSHHVLKDAERIELYRDHRGFHLEATYREEVTR